MYWYHVLYYFQWNANYPFDNIRAVQIPSVVDPITGVNTQFPLNSGLQGTAINSFPLGTVNQGIPISPLPGSTGVRPTLDGIGLPGLRSDTLWSRINTWKKWDDEWITWFEERDDKTKNWFQLNWVTYSF